MLQYQIQPLGNFESELCTGIWNTSVSAVVWRWKFLLDMTASSSVVLCRNCIDDAVVVKKYIHKYATFCRFLFEFCTNWPIIDKCQPANDLHTQCYYLTNYNLWTDLFSCFVLVMILYLASSKTFCLLSLCFIYQRAAIIWKTINIWQWRQRLPCKVCTVAPGLFIQNCPSSLRGSLRYNILAIWLKGSFGRDNRAAIKPCSCAAAARSLETNRSGSTISSEARCRR